VRGFLARRSWPALAGLAAATIGAAVPAIQLGRNYAVNDHHLRTFETRYFDALFEIVPERTTIVSEAYSIDEILRYKLLGEQAAQGRDVRLASRNPDEVRARLAEGHTVFAFDIGREQLEPFGFAFEPVALPDLALPEYLRAVRPGSIVAIAARPGAAHGFTPRRPQA